jgi:hypothetical protein
MSALDYWQEMDKITKERITELNIALTKAASGMHMRWLQATLETNYAFNHLANNMITTINLREQKRQERELFRKGQFRANDD